jgi:hypothetical protein
VLIVAITGSGDTTLNNASALLDDYLPVDDVLVYVPSYITSDGMRVVVQWLRDANINIERVKKHLLSSYLLGNPEPDKSLIVLGVEGSEEIIQEVMSEDVAVYDLTRGLYRVSESEIPLSVPESDVETRTGESGTPVGSGDDLGLESLTEPQPDLQERVARLERKLTEIESRINWEHTANPRMPVAPEPSQEKELDAEREGTVKYFQNGKGKVRKAGRSRIKPGEKEVWLTEDEVESATS